MNEFLDTKRLPQYCFSHFRKFDPHERHITRHCAEDVLLLMLGGILRFSEDGIPVTLTKGEYYIQKKGLFQQGTEDSDTPYYYYVHFFGEWSGDIGIRKRGIFPSEVAFLAKRLSALNDADASFLEKTAVFYEILTLLRSEGRVSDTQRLATDMARFIEENIRNGITADGLAEHFNFSKNYLIRIFKKNHDTTPYEYLTRLRLNQARQLLRYSDLSVERIAEECGFGDYVGFYKAFVKKNGCTPSELRK